MATPVQFPEANCNFVGQEEEVLDLPAWRGFEGHNPVIISCWELSEEELQEIQKNKQVFLTVFGLQTPPIAVGVNPFEVK